MKNNNVFKIGDKIRITNNCKCSGIKQKQGGQTGIVYGVYINSLYVTLPGSPGPSGSGRWIHHYSCVEHLIKGFDPEDIINESFKWSV